MFDDNGNTPLHVACQLDPPIEVLISLKDAVTQTNSWGATPLHIAVSHRCNVQALKKLIDYFPGALCRLSRMHRTPIHYACMSYRGLDLVAFQILLEQTIKESHRLQEEQQHHQQHNITQEHLSCDSKITDFIDILREAKDDIRGDNILDDEEISVLMIDSDSQHAVAASSSDLSSLPSSVNARRIFSNQIEEEENDAFGHDKNNYNVVTWKDTSGKTPLGLLFQRYRERVKRVIEILEQMKNSTPNRPRTSSSLQTDLGHLWGKARLIVVLLAEEHQQQQQRHQKIPHSIGNIGATGKRDDDSSASAQHWSQAASWSKERLSNRHVDENSNKIKIDHNFDDKKMIPTEERQFRIVHASVGLTGYGCPPEMIRLAISIYPHQVREMDENGNLVGRKVARYFRS
jgi:ankyrin repeat protein